MNDRKLFVWNGTNYPITMELYTLTNKNIGDFYETVI